MVVIAVVVGLGGLFAVDAKERFGWFDALVADCGGCFAVGPGDHCAPQLEAFWADFGGLVGLKNEGAIAAGDRRLVASVALWLVHFLPNAVINWAVIARITHHSLLQIRLFRGLRARI